MQAWELFRSQWACIDVITNSMGISEGGESILDFPLKENSENLSKDKVKHPDDWQFFLFPVLNFCESKRGLHFFRNMVTPCEWLSRRSSMLTFIVCLWIWLQAWFLSPFICLNIMGTREGQALKFDFFILLCGRRTQKQIFADDAFHSNQRWMSKLIV